LRRNGYNGRVPRRKPFISETNRRKRIDFAKNHLNKDILFWKKVLFTDESKFNIFGCDGKGKVWRKVGTQLEIKNTVPTVKHGGGSVLVWGCMAASGVGNLVFIDQIMDRWAYLNILRANLQPSVRILNLGEDWIFQQDQDPKHTAIVTREWLLYNVPKQLFSPPQSPDLNPIEHVWDYLDKKIRSHAITSKESLKNALMEEWRKIPQNYTEKLVDSMPRRLEEVIKQKGNPTKY